MISPPQQRYFKMFKISFHSVCDLITNSSSTIFSWYDGSVNACKELINEILQTFGVDKTADDLFFIGAFADDMSYYAYNHDESAQDIPEMSYETEEQLIKQILRGEIEKPEWMINLETQAKEYDNYNDISFYIEAKEPQYEVIAEKIKAFLYSPSHQEAYN